MSEPLVIIGNGMAAVRLVEELNARALGRYAVAVVGEEPRLAYNRVLLSSLLADEVAPADIEIRSSEWWRRHGVTVLYGHAATEIDPAIRRVRLANGAALPYGRLVLATGSRAIRLGIPGMALPGVLTFRDVHDVDAIRRLAGRGRRAVVIGGGLLGLEAAYGLAKAGAGVTLVHLMDRLMERQLDPHAAGMLARAIAAHGIDVRLSTETRAIVGRDRVEGVALGDGSVVPADLVVVAVGVRPNADLASAAGIPVGRGIRVDDHLETGIAGIHAIGECAEHRGQCYGLVEPAYEQARVLARRLAGDDAAAYPGSVLATNLKVTGVKVFSAGDFLGAPGTEEIVLTDPGRDTYRKLVIADGRLVGAVLVGDTADGLWYLDLIRSGAPIGRMRDLIAFGRELADRRAA